MRNYIEELLHNGVSARTIAKEAGVSVREVNGMSIGMTRLKSGSTAYEHIRNLSRRTDYQIARKKGASAKTASASRRAILRPETFVRHQKVRIVEHSQHGGVFYQLGMIGLWKQEHVRKPVVREIESYSAAHHEKMNLQPFIKAFDTGGWELVHGGMGYGEAHHTEYGKDAIDECIISARGQLGDSNWKLIKIIRFRWVKVQTITD
jgi:hypothetical protein